MTPQEILDTAFERILAQGEPAYDEDTGMCAYRTKDGKCCAAGVLFPDGTPPDILSFQGTFWQLLEVEVFQSHLPSWMRKQSSIIRDVQYCHDGPAMSGLRGRAFLDAFCTQMTDVAKRRHLSAEKLKLPAR